jgi:predicted permease
MPTVLQRGISTGLTIMLLLVLLVACTNLTNLTLARWSRRRGELAIRGALGGTRGRLICELSLESALIAVAGGGLGILLARLLATAIARPVDIGNGYLLIEPRIDPAVVLAVVLAVGLALLVAGIAPGLRATKTDLRSALASDSGTASPRWSGRRYLITLQVATSAVLWILAMSSVRQLGEALAIDTGLDLDQLAVAEIDFGQQQYDEARARQLVSAVRDQLSRRPDVESAAVSSGLPIGLGTGGGAALTVPGLRPVLIEFMASTPAIFETLGVPIVHGRGLDPRDIAGSEPVVVLSEATARALFDTPNAVGRQVQLQRRRMVGESDHPVETLTVVGIAADTDTGSAGRRDHGTTFLPLAQHYEDQLVISVRTADPARLVADIRNAIASVDPQLAISRIGTGTAVAGPSLTFLRMTLALFGTLAAFTMMLALAGLSGVLSQIVAGRRREIGVRMALGADPSRVRRLVVWEGMSPVVLGLVLGLGLGAIGRLALQPLLGRLTPAADAAVLGSVAVLFVLVGVAVCYVPARRAARVSPSLSLRSE